MIATENSSGTYASLEELVLKNTDHPVEADRLLGAPRIYTVEEAVQGKVQSSARAYWNR